MPGQASACAPSPQPRGRLEDPSGEGSPSSSALPAWPEHAETIIADGYTASLYVERGHLVISDQLGPERRELRLNRATSKVRSIIIGSVAGSISLSAVKWCEDLGISLIVLDSDRVRFMAGTGKADDAGLRRSQAKAQDNKQGIEITRYLLGRKVRGQRDVLREMGYEIPTVDHLCEAIGQAKTISECLGIEAQVASLYWDAWSAVECPWSVESRKAIPAHWKTAGPRTSLKSKGPRNAVTPIQAIMNYAYRLAEAQTTLALLAVGLDPGLGIFHKDAPNRASMSLDCMEAIRPTVDLFVLQLISTRPFSRGDVGEDQHGVCRLRPRLTGKLATLVPTLRGEVAPVAEELANMLRPRDALGRRFAPTRLSHRNSRVAQARVKTLRKRAVA